MNLKENGTCCVIAKKLNEIRRGNRMMVNDDVNLTMTFYKRDNPESKCGVVKVSGGFDFSLLDAGIFLAAATLVLSVLSAVRSFFRRF